MEDMSLEQPLTTPAENDFVELVFSAPGHPLEDSLIELNELKAGWLNGIGEAIAPHAISIARDVSLLVEKTKKFALPTVFPMPDGGIQLQWLEKDNSIVYHIEISKYGQLFVTGLKLEPQEDFEQEFKDFNEAVEYLVKGKEQLNP